MEENIYDKMNRAIKVYNGNTTNDSELEMSEVFNQLCSWSREREESQKQLDGLLNTFNNAVNKKVNDLIDQVDNLQDELSVIRKERDGLLVTVEMLCDATEKLKEKIPEEAPVTEHEKSKNVMFDITQVDIPKTEVLVEKNVAEESGDMESDASMNENEVEEHFCPNCQLFFSTLDNLKVHLKTVHSKLEISQVMSLKDDANQGHHDNSNQEVDYNKIQVGEERMEDKLQKDDWPIDCKKCGVSLDTLHNLNQHMDDHWTDDRCCPICDILILDSNRKNFRQHLQIHTGVRPFVCDLCPSLFRRRSVLNKHRQIHTREKPFECRICSRAFRQKNHMLSHIVTQHPNSKLGMSSEDVASIKSFEIKKEANFHCDYPGCNGTYSKRSHLKEHQRIHTSEKPYICLWEGCSSKFGQAGTLTRHYRKHTGEKPYRCELCDRAFAQSGILDRHMETHVK